jgi:asparagine synthase (glutamine-hydrolysing)
MCGIAGLFYFDKDQKISSNLLIKMRDSIAHRGPDDSGIYIDNNLGIAHRRLSIIDLSSHGHQPMSNFDKSIWIVFNGEFYNYQDYISELQEKGYAFRSKTDTEVVLNLYQEYGIEKTLERINGMFSFAIWDSRIKKMYVCRDRLGIKPLFYSNNSQKFIFASEIKAILASGLVSKEINKQAIYDYFSLKSIPAPATAFNNILKLMPGHYLTVTGLGVEDYEYWDLEVKKFHSESEASVITKVEQLLSESVQKRMISDVSIGAFLSGGVDSSAIVAMMAKYSKDLNTYSIGLNEYTEYDETSFAKIVSEKYQTNHQVFDLKSDLFNHFDDAMSFFDEPFAISSSFALYFLSELTKKEVSVVLSGDGGDEIFAGYSTKYGRDQLLNKLSWIPKSLPRFLVALITKIFSNKNQTPSFIIKAQKFLNYLSLSVDEAYYNSISVYNEFDKEKLFSKMFFDGKEFMPISHVFKKHYSKQKFNDHLQRRLYGEIKSRLQDEMLTKVDRMSMVYGLEARTPLLDHKFVEYVFNINSKYKLKNRSNGKVIFKKMLEKYLPNNILYRKKSGFSIPIDYWFKNQLSDFVDNILSEEELKKHGLFNINYVNQLKKHQRKGNAYGTKSALYNHIFLLVVFQLWYKKHFEN